VDGEEGLFHDQSLWTLPLRCNQSKNAVRRSAFPAISPDGSRIAFTQGQADGTWQLATMASDGSDLGVMTSGPGVSEAPSWSPDGTWLAYDTTPSITVDASFHTVLRRIAADGSDDRPLGELAYTVFDTETTGLEPAQGHRIIEIGCVELLDRKLTGSRFHVYLNPEREVDAGAVAVHGLSNDFLADKPRFADIVQDFIDFVIGAELIIHNAPFDVGFLNHELNRLTAGYKTIGDYCAILDTLLMARKKHPGQRNSLDALCKRYGIDNSQRTLHGALLDAEILADIYLAMTRQQDSLFVPPTAANAIPGRGPTQRAAARQHRSSLAVIRADAGECAAHASYLDLLDKSSGGSCVWRRLDAAESV